MDKEYEYGGLLVNGFLMLFLALVVAALGITCAIVGGEQCLWLSVGGGMVCFVALIFMLIGYFVQEPNEARVMIFFGKYKGTCRRVGFFWTNPFMTRRKLSLRIRNMDINPIKVNDRIGNPVLIGMVLVWKIKDTYKVVFDLDSASLGATGGISNAALTTFVNIQSDAALREVTGQFAYDQTEASAEEMTLRDGGEVINELLEKKINERLAMAGMEVVEARLNYLAYAPEIAAVMLRRQQASAIIMAREKIVEGAVSMVEMALKRIEEGGLVEFDPKSRATMVSNLMLVLCADEPVTPVVNTNN